MSIKRTLSMICIIAAMMFLCGAFMRGTVFATDEIIDSGTCGENATWTLTGTESNMALTISGTGDMSNYFLDEAPYVPWMNYREKIKKVVIESGITSIGMYNFAFCKSLVDITIPSSVTSVGYSAFCYCSSLADIKIPNGVSTIEEDAFYRCTNLKSITLPNSLTSISGRVFVGCTSLTSITLPNSLTYIDSGAFNEIKKNIILMVTKDSYAHNYASSGQFKYDLTTGHQNDSGTVIKEATCTEDGLRVYKCLTCGRTVSEEVIHAGHIWNAPTYSWSSDKSTVTATRICERNNSHKQTETVKTTSRVTKAATYTAKGKTTYTAKFSNDAFATQTKTLTDIDKLPKKVNTMTVKAKKPIVQFSKLEKKNQTIPAKKAFSVNKAKGKVTYKVTTYDKKAKKKIKVLKTGKVTVKKGLKKGAYKLKVRVTAEGNTKYKSKNKTVKLTIKVK